jgi:hypothetical protein
MTAVIALFNMNWRLRDKCHRLTVEKAALQMKCNDLEENVKYSKLLLEKSYTNQETLNHANSLVRAFMQPAEHFDIGRSLKGKTTVFAFHGEDRYFNVVKVFDSSDADANEKKARELVKMLEE